MREVGVLEAKTSFTQLIAEVERTGEGVTVTRRGKAAVRIMPVQTTARPSPEQRAATVRDLLARRDAQPFVEGFDDLSWEELKRIGRGEDRYG
ncbi:type II toxin-antitoxin system Phd/YefM family antitoxin [Brevundimonas sp. Leaf363]|uniref:type II toxin-antitoxin system Phd/YefM family antitoxin n=1 Tax=Brevundimonas sp. Leaf363 TaxID=1736353 RepID=UPI0009E90342|nr:type II toxin-antitoxin system Phd/YefM family antitoxin [Brevundimonas sp. Leaf363]